MVSLAHTVLIACSAQHLSAGRWMGDGQRRAVSAAGRLAAGKLLHLLPLSKCQPPIRRSSNQSAFQHPQLPNRQKATHRNLSNFKT